MRKADRERLAGLRSTNRELREELAASREVALYWERTAVRVKARLEESQVLHRDQVAELNATIRELVQTIAKYPDSLADILNPRVESQPTVGMESVGFDDALGAPTGMYPAFEDDPQMNGRPSPIQETDEEWAGG